VTAWVSALGSVAGPDEECDVLVVGSGAGGLATAVTAAYHGLRVVVVEKGARCGGATARSGGWMWTPGNPFARAAGVREDVMKGPRQYLKGRCGGNFKSARVDAFLEAASDMVAFFHCRTALRLTPGSWICDIHGDTPGAGEGHRSVAPAPLDARTLSRRVRRLLPRQLYETSFLGMGIMAGPDLRGFLDAAQLRPGGVAHAARRLTRHLLDLLLHRHGEHLVNGAALVGRLLQSADDLGAVVHVGTAARSLVKDGTGRVVGAVVEGPAGTRVVGARRGVVLAAGGFPADRVRRVETFPRGTGADHHTLAPPTDTGDGLSMGEWAGGHLDSSVASPVAWCPVSLVPYRSGRCGVFPHILDRGKPGVIGVVAGGQRFVNEADGYHDYVLGMLRAVPEGEEVQSWLVADHRFVRRYPLGMAKPRPVPLWPYLHSGYLVRGRTLEELARRCGIDPAGLAATVARFNDHARHGEDPDFGRGRTPFNRSSGDANVGPNPSLAPIETAPFYAVRLLPGSFGTFLGLEVDEAARVLDDHGTAVPGLHAVGTDQSSVFGGHYPSGGINLGPAMVSGYLAGRDLAGQPAAEVDPVEAEAECREP
jgi:succinate dehydrogenase/fumarate reductase flavoprotein subunit